MRACMHFRTTEPGVNFGLHASFDYSLIQEPPLESEEVAKNISGMLSKHPVSHVSFKYSFCSRVNCSRHV